MKYKTQLRFATLATFAFAAAAALGGLAVIASQPAAEGGAHAAWISSAETIAEQSQEADLIVRVQVVDQAEPRFMWSPTPDGIDRADGRSTFAFTDTQVEVLEVYDGKAEVGDRLWTLQTGGDLVTKTGAISRLELDDDPLYRVGQEMVLFLVDISDDPVHANGRPMFRTVNPMGRFEIEGDLASRTVLTDSAKAAGQVSLAALEAQIAASVNR